MSEVPLQDPRAESVLNFESLLYLNTRLCALPVQGSLPPPSPWTIVGLYLELYGGPRGAAAAPYERGTPLPRRVDHFPDSTPGA